MSAALQRLILRVLERRTAPMAESTLLAEVNLEADTPVTPSLLRRELAQLDAEREVVSVRDKDRGTVWMITAQGRARVAQ